MPNYERQCDRCKRVMTNLLETVSSTDYDCDCGGVLKRVIIGGTGLNPIYLNNINGDECDVTVRNGICNPDGSPRRYTSKAEMAKVGAKAGYTNHVEHIGLQGTDKSPHTVRWSDTPGVLNENDNHKRKVSWWAQEHAQFGTPIPEEFCA